MIRRDIRLADGSQGWMLISQIEHARISAELASHAIGTFGVADAPVDRAPSPACPPSVRQEVLEAIRRHDDGWVEWERAPRLDPKLRCPLTFTELEPEEALAIWSDSIAAAESIGPLAASMVAGHFMRLLDHGDARHTNQAAVAWSHQMSTRREAWLSQWFQIDPPAHTPERAAEALQWLWTFDEISLWFCTACRAAGEATAQPTSPYLAGRGTPLEMQLLAAAARAGRAAATPFRFEGNKIAIGATGQIAPLREYTDSAELLRAAQSHRMAWQLVRC